MLGVESVEGSALHVALLPQAGANKKCEFQELSTTTKRLPHCGFSSSLSLGPVYLYLRIFLDTLVSSRHDSSVADSPTRCSSRPVARRAIQ